MLRLPQPRRKPDQGQSLAEFALIAPIFFLLVFFVIQLGLVMASQNGLVDGVRSATRRAATYRINEQTFQDTAVGGILDSICKTIDTELKTRLGTRVIGYNQTGLTRSIVYEWQQNPGTTGYFVVAHVTATYGNKLYVPLVSWFLDRSDGTVDNKLTLNASEQMRIENPSLDAPANTAPVNCAPYLP